VSTGNDLVVQTKAGKVEGQFRDDLYVFRGVPYAIPPVGPRRWLPPAPVEPWTGIRPAKAVGNVAPQNQTEPGSPLYYPRRETQSEDCLYLNVWTPGLDDAKRPVMFWIHGGGFRDGAGSRPDYKGASLSQRGDVVVVTINYRLNAFGFLNLNEVTKGRIPSTGNEGILDQAAALEWVHDNIAAFGGDPENVTIFGESAGAMSVATLLATPKARGLFKRAIMQSGAASSVYSVQEAADVARQYLEILGIKGDDVDALRAASVEQLLAAEKRLSAVVSLALRPVVDGQALPQAPLAAVREGVAAEIALLMGTNRDEEKLFALSNPGLDGLDEARLLKICEETFSPEEAQTALDTYRQARAKRGEDITPYEILMAMGSDQRFRIPAIRLAEAQRRHQPAVYFYLFTWPATVMGGKLGSCHAVDIGFVFGTYNEYFCGTGPAAEALSHKVQDAWLAFARTGNPSCKSLGAWPAYGEKRETMVLGEQCYVAEAPYEEERRLWETLADKISRPVYADRLP